jgi:hypothetical protein
MRNFNYAIKQECVGMESTGRKDLPAVAKIRWRKIPANLILQVMIPSVYFECALQRLEKPFFLF